MDQITLQVGVKILIKNSENKYLLIRRNPKKYPEIGPEWDIVGGRINPGASLFQNLEREVMEETGLEISGQPKLIAAQDILRVPGRHVVRLTYLGEASGKIKIDEESLEYKWFTEKEIEELPERELDMYFRELIGKIFKI
jgi:ADP-ribose pyrophosphatase YjhB (NUDIX family)